LRNYWSTQEIFTWPFRKTPQNEIDPFIYIHLHILLTIKTNLARQQWKIRITFNKLCDSYGIYYSQIEYLAVDEIIMLFKSRVIFK